MSLSAPSGDQLRNFYLDCSLQCALEGNTDMGVSMLSEAVRAAPLSTPSRHTPTFPETSLALDARDVIENWLPWLEHRYPDMPMIRDFKKASHQLLILAATHA